MKRFENSQIPFGGSSAFEREQKEMNSSQTYQNMDNNIFMPKSLMNDSDNLVLDGDDRMVEDEFDDLNAEEFIEGNDQKRFYSHYTQSIGVNQSNRNPLNKNVGFEQNSSQETLNNNKKSKIEKDCRKMPSLNYNFTGSTKETLISTKYTMSSFNTLNSANTGNMLNMTNVGRFGNSPKKINNHKPNNMYQLQGMRTMEMMNNQTNDPFDNLKGVNQNLNLNPQANNSTKGSNGYENFIGSPVKKLKDQARNKNYFHSNQLNNYHFNFPPSTKQFSRPICNVDAYKKMNSTEDGMKPSFMAMKKTIVPQFNEITLKVAQRHSSKGPKQDNEDKELMGHINNDLSSLVRTPKGSRILQMILDRIPPEILDLVLENLKEDFSFLMTDTNGNYLYQKILQCCSANQRIYILKHIRKDFAEIASNPCGSDSLQSLVDIADLKEEEELIKECVKDDVVKLSLDCNATHVIQTIVSCLNEKDRKEINEVILRNFLKLVSDSNGILVLKKFINGNECEEIRKLLIDIVIENALEIIENPFGSYIVTHLFDEFGVQCCIELMKIIVNNVISLSVQKFSSNVVEKCLDLADEASRMKIIQEVFNSAKISSLINNKYGNYVLIKAISIIGPAEKLVIKEDLVNKITITCIKEKAKLKALIDCL